MSVKFKCKCGVDILAFTSKPGDHIKCNACGAELVVPSRSFSDTRTGVVHVMKTREIQRMKNKAQGIPFEESAELPVDNGSSSEMSSDQAAKLQELPSIDEILGDDK